MTDQRLREMVADLVEAQRETDRMQKETAQVLKETGHQLKELGRQLGGLGDKFGSYTEGLALPSMRKILKQRFNMDIVAARVNTQLNGRSFEVDVLAYSRSGIDEAYVVEVKSHLRGDAIDQMKRILREFHDFFPEHRGKKVYGILAAVDAPAAVCARVLREGIYLAHIHDGELELQVPEGFKARGF